MDRVLRLAVREVRLRQLEEDVPDARVGAPDPRQEVPRLLAVSGAQRVARRLEAPAGAEEERDRLVEPAPLLEDLGRLGELPRGAVEHDRPLPVFELAVDAGRGLGLPRGLVRRRGLAEQARLQEERGGPLELARLPEGARRLRRLHGSLVERRGLLPLLGPRPGVGGPGPVGLSLEVAGLQLGGRLQLPRPRPGVRRRGEVSPSLQLPRRVLRLSRREEERPGEQRLAREAERLGGFERPARGPSRFRRPLPQRVLPRSDRRPLGDPPAGVREGLVVSGRFRDLREPVPPRGLPGLHERPGPRGLRPAGVARRLPGLRRFPGEGVSRLFPELGGGAHVSQPQLQRGDPCRQLPLSEHAVRLLGVPRFQVQLPGAREVARPGRFAGGDDVGVLRARGAESQQEETERGEVDREAREAVPRQELVDGRLPDVARRVGHGGDEPARQGEELVQVDSEDDEKREEQGHDGRPEEVPQLHPLLAQEAPEGAQDEQEDEERRELRGPVEPVLHPLPRDRLSGHVRLGPVDVPQQGQLTEHRHGHRYQVFLPGLLSAHAPRLSTIERAVRRPATISPT